jgi:hypothetical protein
MKIRRNAFENVNYSTKIRIFSFSEMTYYCAADYYTQHALRESYKMTTNTRKASW